MNKQRDPFLNFIFLSIGFHVFILMVLTVKVLFFPSDMPDYKQAVRIDVVALPEKQTAPPQPVVKKPMPVEKKQVKKPTPKKPKPKPPKPKPKKVVLKKTKVKKVKEEQDSAIARLRALQKLKEQNKKPEAALAKEYKGNAVSKGNSLVGLEKLHHESYLDELDGHIRNFWNLPEWLASGNLKASVLLLINRNGAITGKSFIMKSGNDLFDQHVFSTLEKASPLPAPPAKLIDFYATKGVEIRFPE